MKSKRQLPYEAKAFLRNVDAASLQAAGSTDAEGLGGEGQC